MSRPRFHMAFPIHDIAAARGFYVDLLGAKVGRVDPDGVWIDFDLWGHQLSAHVAPEECDSAADSTVDGEAVPLRHFGVLLDWADWEGLAAKLSKAGVGFVVEPHVRFQGKAGEQGTFFVRDPSGNALEFKTFRDDSKVFAADWES